MASSDAKALRIFLYLSRRRYDYDHRLMMYSKAERRIYERASGVFFFCPGRWSLDEMYAFTREGRVRIGALSTFYVFHSICMGIGREIHL